MASRRKASKPVSLKNLTSNQSDTSKTTQGKVSSDMSPGGQSIL